MMGHRRPSQHPPYWACLSKSSQLCPKPPICKAGASGHEHICLGQNIPSIHVQVMYGNVVYSKCKRSVLPVMKIPSKLHLVRILYKQISFLSASLVGLVLVGDAGLVLRGRGAGL